MRQASRRKHHYIYKTTCTVTGRWYIGMHSTDDLEDGYIGSGTDLARSIRKHGIENHECVILEYSETREALRKREAELVTEAEVNDLMCMNLTAGGEGGWEMHNADPANKHHRQAGAKAMNETLWSNDEWRARKALLHSEVMKKHYASGQMKCHLPSWIGKTHSPETKAKLSQIAKARFAKSTGS